MSLILDALKKLDRETSSRRDKVANIAVEILRSDLPFLGKRIRVYLVVLSLTVVATVAVTYAVMVQFGFLSKSSPSVPGNPSAPSKQIALPPFSHGPARDARDEMTRVAPKMQNPAESKRPAGVKTPTEVKTSAESKSVETSLEKKKASQEVISEEAEVAPGNGQKTAEQSPDGSATALPSLRLSGIVWSEEPSNRFAMINGAVATEGSVIEGVKVVEIYPTRVLLSHKGQSFEISMFK